MKTLLIAAFAFVATWTCSAQCGVPDAWAIPQGHTIPGFYLGVAGGNVIEARPYHWHKVPVTKGISYCYYDSEGAFVLHAETIGWCALGCDFVGHFTIPIEDVPVKDTLVASELGRMVGRFSVTDATGKVHVFRKVTAAYVQPLFRNGISNALGVGSILVQLPNGFTMAKSDVVPWFVVNEISK